MQSRFTKTAIIVVISFIVFYTLSQYKLYTSFNNDNYFLQKHIGSKITLLCKRKYENKKIKVIIQVLDSAVNEYIHLTDEQKKNRENIFIASVNTTCGSGCGELGGNKIEITFEKFEKLYNGVDENDSYDHLPFYELGRVFWVFSDQLNYDQAPINHSLHTGFAVFMRFVIMKNLEIKCSPINGKPFPEHLLANKDLFEVYKSDTSYSFINTLKYGKGIPNEYGLGASNLFASILFNLYDNYGKDEFLKKLWSKVKNRPKTSSVQDIVDNFFIACSLAAHQDLTGKFLNEFKWPVSEKYHYFYENSLSDNL